MCFRGGQGVSESFLPSGFPSAGVSHGLYNQGSTCYLSSILQLLYMTPEFHDRCESVGREGVWGSGVALFTRGVWLDTKSATLQIQLAQNCSLTLVVMDNITNTLMPC